MSPERSGARSSVRGYRAWLGAAAALATGSAAPAASQSPRAANPERPTFATHAYAVAPGYAELEQGLAARGTGSLREATSWDVNLKVGLSPHVQLGLFGPLYTRTSAGSGVGDLGAALKVRTDLSSRAAVALVPSVTAPTGSEARGLGAGRALGGLVAVVSAVRIAPGGAGSRLAGVLGAATIRLAEWAVVDAGGAVGATDGTPDQLFLGITTNLGRLF